MESDASTCPGNSHILGDPAYPLKKNLMVAYKNNGRLTAKQDQFNNSLSAARSCIERAFSHLKGRWRRLKYLDMSDIERVPRVIIACCVLHNICIKTQDELVDVDAAVITDPRSVADDDRMTTNQLRSTDLREASQKRDMIANELFDTR